VLNDIKIPDRVTPEAERVLRDLTFHRAAGRNPPEHWFTTLRDAPRRGVVRAEVQRLATAALRDLPAPVAAA
jgi:acetoin utilization protein AcuC